MEVRPTNPQYKIVNVLYFIASTKAVCQQLTLFYYLSKVLTELLKGFVPKFKLTGHLLCLLSSSKTLFKNLRNGY